MAFDHDSLNFSLVGKIPRFVPLTKEFDVKNKHIALFGGDLGGVQAALRPLALAAEADCPVYAYLMGGAAAKLSADKLAMDPRILAITIAEDSQRVREYACNQHFSLMVTTGTQSLGGKVAAAELTAEAIMVSRAPVLMLEDMYGSSHDILRILQARGSLHKISCLCVSDDFSRDLLVRAGFDLGDRIVVTGAPQFDAVPEMLPQWLTKREMLRQVIGAPDGTNVFLVVGGKAGTAEILQLLEDALVAMDFTDRAKVIFRPHPSAPDDDKAAVEQYLKKTEMTYFKNVSLGVAPNTNALLPGVDYVLSAFGTTNTMAILCQMPGVIYIGTSGCLADLKSQKGLDRPPEVKHGAAWYAQTPTELEYVIQNIMSEGTSAATAKIKAVQQDMGRYADGKSAERVWQEMQRLMA